MAPPIFIKFLPNLLKGFVLPPRGSPPAKNVFHFGKKESIFRVYYTRNGYGIPKFSGLGFSDLVKQG